MSKGRLEAFSDGVIAILITIMVLELRPRSRRTWQRSGRWCRCSSATSSASCTWASTGTTTTTCSRRPRWSMAGRCGPTCSCCSGCRSFPFATAWMGEGGFAPVPTALYGCVLLAAALSYTLLVRALRRVPGQSDTIGQASGVDRKGSRPSPSMPPPSWSRWWHHWSRSPCTWSWRSSGSSPTGASSARWRRLSRAQRPSRPTGSTAATAARPGRSRPRR